jgi:PKD-like domain
MTKKSPRNSLRVLIVLSAILPLLLWSLSSSAFHSSGVNENLPTAASAGPSTQSVGSSAPASVGYILPSLSAPLPVTVGPGIASDGDPGGFGIEGDLRSNFPGTDRSTDWVANPSPTPSGSPVGDYLLNNDGSPRTVYPANGNGNITRHFVDGVGSADQDILGGGDKFNDNPTLWSWAVGKPPQKNDINHALLHQAIDAAGNTWIVVAGDQGSAQGDRYIDFELLQKPVMKTFLTPTSGGFSSGGTDAGRTVGDLLLTVQLSNGGAAAQFFVFRWQASASSPIGFDYIAEPNTAGNVFIAANTGGSVAVPYSAFGTNSYPLNTFAEAAVNLNALLQNFGFNPCIGIKTLLIKTKTSTSSSAQLKDFIEPIQLEFGSAPSSTITAADVCASASGNTASVPDAGPSSTYNWSITNGTIDSGQGTNQISYTAGSSGTVQLTVAVNNKAGCGSTTSPPKSVTINPLPTVFNVTGGGSYCTGGSGVAVGLSGSQTGVNYQLVRDSNINVGSPVAGTGSALNFGNQTASGTYTVIATGSGSCMSNMNGSAIVTVNPLPLVYNVTGGGSYCSGGAGLPVGLDGSQSGASYQLKLNGTNVGSPVTGNGSPISFGNQTAAGTYTVEANSGTSCPRTMTGNATISINSLPTAFTVTGGGTYCEGGTGVSVGLSSSQTGVNYQLKRGASNVGSPVAGSGVALNFGNQTVAGTYTVVATNASTSCTNDMTGNAVVAVEANPTVFTVTSGGTYCQGGVGLSVGLSGSQSGVNYQLKRGGSSVGSAVPGTGSALDFGKQTVAGTYTVVATNNTATACSSNMSGNAVITVEANPTTFTVTGGGTYCEGGTGVSVGLSGSQSGVNYQLQRGGSNVGSAVPGTGSALDFGKQTVAGTYTVAATNNTATACSSNMSGNAVVTVEANPTTFTVTGGGTYCAGGTGLPVGLSGSQSGVNYQLQRNGSNVGSSVTGNGSALNFGNQTVAGTYTVVATNATTTACSSNMSGNAVIAVEANPTTFTVTGGGSYCEGGTGVPVGLSGSQSGVNYQLQRNGSNVGSPVAGSGPAINFGNQTVAGTYTVVATNATTTACPSNMSGNAVITVEANPTVFSVTGGGSYCAGGTGVAVGLNGSQTGVNYQLQRNASNVGSPVPGTGFAITFGSQTTVGTYTVVATNNSANACSGPMNGSASVSVDQPPTVTLALNLVCDDQGGQQQTQLVATPNPGGANYTFSWTGPDGVIVDQQNQPITGPAITPTKPGTYSVLVTNTSTGCSVSGSFKLCFSGSQIGGQAAFTVPAQNGGNNSSLPRWSKPETSKLEIYLTRIFSMFG